VGVVVDAATGALASHDAASSTAVIHAVIAVAATAAVGNDVVVGKVAFADDYDVAATALSGGSVAAVIISIGLLLLLLLLDLTSDDLFSYQIIQRR
jgi:hypothetical protein